MIKLLWEKIGKGNQALSMIAILCVKGTTKTGTPCNFYLCCPWMRPQRKNVTRQSMRLLKMKIQPMGETLMTLYLVFSSAMENSLTFQHVRKLVTSGQNFFQSALKNLKSHSAHQKRKMQQSRLALINSSQIVGSFLENDFVASFSKTTFLDHFILSGLVQGKLGPCRKIRPRKMGPWAQLSTSKMWTVGTLGLVSYSWIQPGPARQSAKKTNNVLF